MKEIGLYIHIPFCVAKCIYCDFLSGPAGKDVQEKYIEMLLEEMEQYADRICYTSTGVPVGINVTDSHILENMGLAAADDVYLAWFNNSDRKDNFRPFFDYVMNYTAE